MLSSCELVLKTANHIERNPRSYRYTINRIPRCLNDTGCILGWMAHFACERDHGSLTSQIIARITCDPVYACRVEYNDFFKRLDECYPIHRGHWRSDAKHAVAALRAYAARYPEAPALPVWARMRDREAAAAQRSYARFRARLALPPISTLENSAHFVEVSAAYRRGIRNPRPQSVPENPVQSLRISPIHG
jgi:hypothetical protein